MQRPTCTHTRIITTDDAHRLFHAAGVLHILGPMVFRRLDAEERRLVQPGSVFVWEERSTSSEATGLGIERWTDGLRWGPSRVRDDFLFYQEKFTRNEGQDVLTKQTYSAWVKLPTGRKKWHLTAYFTQATLHQMKTINDIPCLRAVAVPPDMYHRASSGKRKKGFRRPVFTDHPSPPHSDEPEEALIMPFDPHLQTPPPVRRFSVSESDDNDQSSASSHSQAALKKELAPLSYLQSLNHFRRHPADEHILRGFPSIN